MRRWWTWWDADGGDDDYDEDSDVDNEGGSDEDDGDDGNIGDSGRSSDYDHDGDVEQSVLPLHRRNYSSKGLQWALY